MITRAQAARQCVVSIVVFAGVSLSGSSADELGAHPRAEIAKLTKVVADAKIRLEDARQ
jgi:hypothetical protein